MTGLIQQTIHSQKRIPVTILGATGVVGQRFLSRIARHPWFYPAYLTGSERTSGRLYRDACQWHVPGEPYAGCGDVTVSPSDPEHAFSPIVFSALDAKVAREVEPLFARAGAYVFSNASAFRMEEDIPLLIPEINPDHFALIETQQTCRNWKGAIITNPNCTTVMLASALAPLHAAFGVEAVMMTSMQAISGAGYPGVSALDIAGNLIPYIQNEEPKVESESNKILGRIIRAGSGAAVIDAPFAVSATCTRVPVIDGHTLSVSVRLGKKATLEEVADAFEGFVPRTAPYHLPSAPAQFLALSPWHDRPQPRIDVDVDGGMRIHVGRVRTCPILDYKFIIMGNNIERGAAGASVLNAELALSMDVMKHLPAASEVKKQSCREESVI
ncbi:MAG: aspartate-semialdehyde dehydrogenase [Rectinema sp.]|nr:aspartate-semialdehyde dehydrogenase [Rectinema sp.]